MPDTVGVREFKNQASRLLRSVREEMSEYVITLHGEPIAILRPLSAEELQNLKQAGADESVAQMKALGYEPELATHQRQLGRVRRAWAQVRTYGARVAGAPGQFRQKQVWRRLRAALGSS